jgi:hypothetical protein
MLITNRSCPVADRLFDDYIKTSPEIKQIEEKYSRLRQFLGEKSGLNRTLKLYKDVSLVHDPLTVEV